MSHLERVHKFQEILIRSEISGCHGVARVFSPPEFLKMIIILTTSVQGILNPLDYDVQNRFSQIDSLLCFRCFF